MKNKKKSLLFNEIVYILCIGLGMLIFLSIISYNADGTNFFGDTNMEDTNLIGKWGNRLADGLLSLTGYGAFLFVAILFSAAYLGLSAKFDKLRYKVPIGFILFFLSLSTILSLCFPDSLKKQAGGIFGHFSSKFLKDHIGILGASILLITLLLISLILLTGIKLKDIAIFLSRVYSFTISRFRLTLGRKQKSRKKTKRITVKLNDKKSIALGRKPRTRILISNGKNGTSSSTGSIYQRKPENDVLVQNIKPEITGKLDRSKVLRDKTRASRHIHEPSIKDERDLYQEKRKAKPIKRITGWKLPPVDLLDYKPVISDFDEESLHKNSEDILSKFKEFKINGQITRIHPGPVVTTYEFKPSPGIKYSKIMGLIDDLCLALRAENIRMSRMLGKATIAIEVPNKSQHIIYLREIIDSDVFKNSPSKLTLSLGKSIVGKNYITDLTKMPHLLMAGTTGSGKSVSINTMICSILYNASPEEVKFIMIDPKRLELGIYDDIPHLLTPVVTDPRLAAAALMWAVQEMNNRLETLSRLSVRNIQQYNEFIKTKPDRAKSLLDKDEIRSLPYLVVVVDELSDLMIVSSAKVEESITRLSQMARAVGIHLIVATQRPSVDVITGIIKANMPSRISFRVFSKIDSRTILDKQGADKLLGRGDMLFIPPGSSTQIRVHGALVTENELENVIRFWKKQGRPLYADGLEEKFEAFAEAAFKKKGKGSFMDMIDAEDGSDEQLYELAKRIVISAGKASTSNIQRKLKIGYNRAARIMDQLEEDGIVGPADGSKPRNVISGGDYLDGID